MRRAGRAWMARRRPVEGNRRGIRAARRRRGRRARGGFTLLELIVVVALLAALAGMALPALLSRVGGSTLEAVKARLAAAASLCRADAQRRSESLELAVRGFQGRTILVSRPAIAEDGAPPDDELLLELPDGYAISLTPPGGDEPGDWSNQVETDSDVDAEGLVLAVYQPDGSASVPGVRFLVFGEEALQVLIARWTGELTLASVSLSDGLEIEDEALPETVPDAAAEDWNEPRDGADPEGPG
jgi:prepilin-type N-terminal cleavage/methylation domain-containing protein